VKDLLARCQRGENEAIETLVRRFRLGALDLAGAFLRDAHLAEDAVQEAFVTALRRMGDLREPSAFPGWFRQIVRTECHRILRRRKEDVPEDMPDPVAETLSPSEELLQTERRRLVRQAIASLPQAGREAAEMFYLDQFDLATIGNRLKAPVGTVKRRLYEARRQMKILLGRVLAEVGEGPPPQTKLPL
jgi:RNA polymerase sigma factor (sigma-70 family)